MNINRKRALLEALKEPMPYAGLADYGLNFDGVVELLNSGMIRRHPGKFGLYSIAPGGQRWLDVQSEVAA